MNGTDQLTPDSIREFAGMTGPCLTLVVEANQPGGAPIEIKNALEAARRKMSGSGFDADAFLKPVEEKARDLGRLVTPRGSLAILRSQALTRTFRVNTMLGAKADVGEHFDIRTLLSIAHSQRTFYILALSQNRTRLLKCTPDTSEEVPFPAGTPASLQEAMQTRKPDHVLDNKSSGGPSNGSMRGVMFGTSTDAEDKSENLLHFFSAINAACNAVLKGQTDPLIPVGVEHEIALYQRVNSYPHLIAPGVSGAPDGLEGNDLHHRALQYLEEYEARPDSVVPADFDKRVGTGHASIHIRDIVPAAWAGRVSHLYFQHGASYMGKFDPVRQRLKYSDDPLDSPVDLIDEAAWQTLQHGGTVRMLQNSAMPNGVSVCALFRYPGA